MEVTVGMNVREITRVLRRRVRTETIRTPTTVERNYPAASYAATPSSKDVGLVPVGFRMGLSLVSFRLLIARKDRLRDV